MNCWSESTNELKTKLILHGEPEIICLTETHLQEDQEVKLDSYQSYSLNQQKTNARANRGSGGVAVLFKDSLLDKNSAEISH